MLHAAAAELATATAQHRPQHSTARSCLPSCTTQFKLKACPHAAQLQPQQAPAPGDASMSFMHVCVHL